MVAEIQPQLARQAHREAIPVGCERAHRDLVRQVRPRIEEIFREIGERPTASFSFSKIFKKVGIKDFRRKRIRIRSRPPSRDEAVRLKMAPNDHVLVTYVTQVDSDDTPVGYAETCYCSSRIELVMDL